MLEFVCKNNLITLNSKHNKNYQVLDLIKITKTKVF